MDVYCLDGQRNDSYAFREYPKLTEFQRVHQDIVPDMSGNSRTGFQRCEACGELLDKWNEPLVGLVVKNRRYDFSSTYDGIRTVSQRFKSAYESAGLTGLIFRQLPDDPEFFAIRPERAVEYDAERRGTRFIKPCAHCGCYESVVGATPVFLKPNANIKSNEFVRSDLEFASDDEKSPLELCGDAAATALRAARLKGLEIELVP